VASFETQGPGLDSWGRDRAAASDFRAATAAAGGGPAARPGVLDSGPVTPADSQADSPAEAFKYFFSLFKFSDRDSLRLA
jgi:hypothetical protein